MAPLPLEEHARGDLPAGEAAHAETPAALVFMQTQAEPQLFAIELQRLASPSSHSLDEHRCLGLQELQARILIAVEHDQIESPLSRNFGLRLQQAPALSRQRRYVLLESSAAERILFDRVERLDLLVMQQDELGDGPDAAADL